MTASPVDPAARAWGARLALWWCDAVTRTAPAEEAASRRGEIASDVHEQAADEHASGAGGWAVSRGIAGRCLRGVPADLSWRIGLERRGTRLRWQLEHPCTPLSALLAICVPINLLADLARQRLALAGPLPDALWAGTLGLSWLILAVAAGALAWRLVAVVRRVGFAPLPLGRLARCRRVVTLAIAIAWSCSAIGRFSENGFLAELATVAWAGVGLGLIAQIVLAAISITTRLARRP